MVGTTPRLFGPMEDGRSEAFPLEICVLLVILVSSTICNFIVIVIFGILLWHQDILASSLFFVSFCCLGIMWVKCFTIGTLLRFEWVGCRHQDDRLFREFWDEKSLMNHLKPLPIHRKLSSYFFKCFFLFKKTFVRVTLSLTLSYASLFRSPTQEKAVCHRTSNLFVAWRIVRALQVTQTKKVWHSLLTNGCVEELSVPQRNQLKLIKYI